MRSFRAFVIFSFFCSIAFSALGQGSQYKFHPIEGPTTITLEGNIARVALPEGHLFLDKQDTKAFFQKVKQPPGGTEVGLVIPKEGGWVAVYDYVATGYIRDDEADRLNADDLLKTIKKNQVEDNKKRKEMGSLPLEIVGWDKPPTYSREKHTLTWSIIARKEGAQEQVLNYVSIALGRYGILGCTVATNYANAGTVQSHADLLSQATSFTSGNDYASWTKGDKVSDITLKRLVTGGGVAAAVYGAAKLGLLAKGAKILLAVALVLKKGIIVVIAGAVALGKKLFGGKKQEGAA